MSNDSKLPSNEGNLKALPLLYEHIPLGKRWPQLKHIENTANPEEHDSDLKFWGYEYLNYKKRCDFCGETFYSKSSRRKYCSYRCTLDAYTVRRRQYRKAKRNKVCLFCKAPFVAKSRKAQFCSLKHRVAYFRQSRRNDSPLRSIESNTEPLQIKETASQ